tara:strand:+ start:99 stop:782 length:684 start_codon:yes stop_codon:yes gene_type:complete
MLYKTVLKKILIISLFTFPILASSGILNVGFDIDDTVLFSRDVFLNIPENKRNPIDYGWVNTQDEKLSIFIEPTIELINYFKENGHNIFFITARSGENGEFLANFLSKNLNFKIIKNKNIFFCPKETINGKRFTTKHHTMQKLKLDLFYGDADTDMIAALKADVHPIRIVRHEKSVSQYGKNYFGNTLDGKTKKYPFKINDLSTFYSKSVGIYGESIYPIIWAGPKK